MLTLTVEVIVSKWTHLSTQARRRIINENANKAQASVQALESRQQLVRSRLRRAAHFAPHEPRRTSHSISSHVVVVAAAATKAINHRCASGQVISFRPSERSCRPLVASLLSNPVRTLGSSIDAGSTRMSNDRAAFVCDCSTTWQLLAVPIVFSTPVEARISGRDGTVGGEE